MIFLFVLIGISLVTLIVFSILHSKYLLEDWIAFWMVISAVVLVFSLFLFIVFFFSAKYKVAKTNEQYEYLSDSEDLENRSFEIANYNESVAEMKSSVLHSKFFSTYFFEKENVLKLEYL